MLTDEESALGKQNLMFYLNVIRCIFCNSGILFLFKNLILIYSNKKVFILFGQKLSCLVGLVVIEKIERILIKDISMMPLPLCL